MAGTEIEVTINLILHDAQNPTPEPAGASEFYAAFGRAIIEWGRFEARFDWLLRVALAWPDGAPVREKRFQELLPKSFSRRIKLWKDAFRVIAVISEFEPEALEIARIADGLSKYRDALAHGHWGDFLSETPLTMECDQVWHKGPKTYLERHEVQIVSLLELAQKSSDLGKRIFPILMRVFEIETQRKAAPKS